MISKIIYFKDGCNTPMGDFELYILNAVFILNAVVDARKEESTRVRRNDV